MDPKKIPVGTPLKLPTELHPAFRPEPILTNEQIREVNGLVGGYNVFGEPSPGNGQVLQFSPSVLQQHLQASSHHIPASSQRTRASSRTQDSPRLTPSFSQRFPTAPHVTRSVHQPSEENSPPELFPNFLEGITTSDKASRSRATSSSKTSKSTFRSFARKFSGPFEKRGKTSADKAGKKASSPPVFDQPSNVGQRAPESSVGALKESIDPALSSKSVTWKETPAEVFLKNVKKKASRVFSKPTVHSPQTPLPPFVLPIATRRRASSSYSRQSARSGRFLETEVPLGETKPSLALEEYTNIVAETRQEIGVDLFGQDSPTLGSHSSVTVHQRLRRSKTRRRRSALYDQQRSRPPGSVCANPLRSPSNSAAVDLNSFLASPLPASAGTTFGAQKNYGLKTETPPKTADRPLQKGGLSDLLRATPLFNPFISQEGDVAARQERINRTRREIDKKLALAKSIGYSRPVIPSKTAPSVTTSPETTFLDTYSSSIQYPHNQAKNSLVKSPTYHRQPSFAPPATPTGHSLSKYSKKWNETDFAKPFNKPFEPASHEAFVPRTLPTVVLEDKAGEEQEQHRGKGYQNHFEIKTEAERPSGKGKGKERSLSNLERVVSAIPVPGRQVDQASTGTANNSREPFPNPRIAIRPGPTSSQEPASVGKLLAGVQSTQNLRIRNLNARNLASHSDLHASRPKPLTSSQSLQIIPGQINSNPAIATNPAPRRVTGGNVASLRARFDQPKPLSSVSPARPHPSHSATGSDPDPDPDPDTKTRRLVQFDLDIRNGLAKPIPRKSAERETKGTDQATEAAREHFPIQEEETDQVIATKALNVNQQEEEVHFTSDSEEKSPSHYSKPKRDFSFLLRTSQDFIPDLVPAPLFAWRPTHKPVGSLFPNNDTDVYVQADQSNSSVIIDIMDRLTSVSAATNRQKAQEDAKAMQRKVIEMSEREGKAPPNYFLMELIGKGSFGRVYKGKHMATAKVVAIKIIDIDASDFSDPSARSNTFSDFMKEINALKIVGDTKAKNINNVIEALSVGKTMWMVSEYCAGGSVATLMRPTPRGLKENWIIPILREVAAAIRSVHDAGIIHRDIKCANVLITEDGAVQLCDFGVAGIIETKVDKRTTFIGTPHWMAPELFKQSPSYGKEVDIWAFGSMAFEMATGLPPNARSGVSPENLGSLFKQQIPRLEGSAFSEGLRAIVAYCLEENSEDRPDIHAVQQHFYIAGTETEYPTSSLIDLVKAFKKWEDHGGSRQSLFYKGGAKGPGDTGTDLDMDNSWNFSTTDAFDEVVDLNTGEQDILQAYGNSVNLDAGFSGETSKPNSQKGRERNRRRAPPEALAPLKAPLERVFDTNTIHGYAEHSEAHYFRQRPQEVQPRSDLPLREETDRLPVNQSIVDHIIDIGEHDAETGLSHFRDTDTIRAGGLESHRVEEDAQDFNRPVLSDPVDIASRRATQDWTFPVRAPPASASGEAYRFPPLQPPSVTPGAGGRPTLHHHPTEPIGVPTQGNRSADRESLIDLDMSIPDESRPSTADSAMSHDFMGDAFHWERHASLQPDMGTKPREREPSLYIPDGADFVGPGLRDLIEQSDFSDNDVLMDYPGTEQATLAFADFDYSHQPARAYDARESHSVADSHDLNTLPPPPSIAALTGNATHEDMAGEMQRMLGGLTGELASFREQYESMGRGRGNGST